MLTNTTCGKVTSVCPVCIFILLHFEKIYANNLGGSVVLIFDINVLIFFVATVLKLSQEDVVQISWQFTVKMLTK